MKVILIVACDEHGCIGNKGQLPWHFSEDLKWFKTNTLGHPVVMGRKTWDGLFARLGGPLPDRWNLILSHQLKCAPCQGSCGVVDNLAYALFFAEHTLQATECFIIGGAEIFKLALVVADEIVLTKVPGIYGGDTFFPIWPLESGGWVADHRVERESKDGLQFWVYKRAKETA